MKMCLSSEGRNYDAYDLSITWQLQRAETENMFMACSEKFISRNVLFFGCFFFDLAEFVWMDFGFVLISFRVKSEKEGNNKRS